MVFRNAPALAHLLTQNYWRLQKPFPALCWYEPCGWEGRWSEAPFLGVLPQQYYRPLPSALWVIRRVMYTQRCTHSCTVRSFYSQTVSVFCSARFRVRLKHITVHAHTHPLKANISVQQWPHLLRVSAQVSCRAKWPRGPTHTFTLFSCTQTDVESLHWR